MPSSWRWLETREFPTRSSCISKMSHMMLATVTWDQDTRQSFISNNQRTPVFIYDSTDGPVNGITLHHNLLIFFYLWFYRRSAWWNSSGPQPTHLFIYDSTDGPLDGIALDPPSNLTVIADNPFSLRCSANCHPPCTYSWFQGPLPRDSAGGKLAVSKATDAEGGSYTCRATNTVGSLVSKPVVVEVQCEEF